MRSISKMIGVAALLALVGLFPVAAQEVESGDPDSLVSTAQPAPVSTAAAPFDPASIPPAVRLSGLRPVYQQYNRCSSAALTIQLSYFGWSGTYDDAIRALNPHSEDVAVRLEEMAAYAQTQGLLAVERYGGTVDMLRALVGAGFPVLVENVYYDGADAFRDWMSHNRVIMGYDDALQTLYSFDSLLGNGDDGTGRPIPYADIDSRWRPFNRGFLVLYRPEEEARVQAALGEHWDATFNLEWALSQSEAEIASGQYDSFTMFNLGSSLAALGRYEEAAEAFDTARTTGLPWRMLWYQYGPFEAYLALERYDDVLTMAREVIATTPGVEEVYYYAALAYQAQGDLIRARGNLEAALLRNPSFAAAREALTALDSTAQAGTSGG